MKISSKLFEYERLFLYEPLKTDVAQIIQISELSLIKGGEIPAHIQVCDEITFAISGKAKIYSGDTVQEMTTGQIHFIRKEQSHRIVADDNQNFRYYCIGFHPNSKCNTIKLFLEDTEKLDSFLVEDEGHFKPLFEFLMNEFYMQDSDSRVMIHFYLCQMLIWLYRIHSGNTKNRSNKINSASSNYAVHRALQYIDREYLRITKVKEVSDELSYNTYYLSHVFKEQMDMTVKDYLMQKKIFTATELLKNSNMSISEISEQLNFSSPHVFSQVFKRYMNMNASEYRTKETLFKNDSLQ